MIATEIEKGTTNMFDTNNKPTGLKRIMLANENSMKGFRWLLKNEAAFKQELGMLVVITPITFLFSITAFEQAVLVISLLFVIFTEVLNTAIEAVVDRIGLEIHPLSGLAKDLGSAAVFIALTIAFILWSVILWPF